MYTPINNIYKKTILKDCIWKQSTKVSFESQGLLPLDSVKIYIPNDNKYVEASNYKGNGWTMKAGVGKDNTYIIKGKCAYNFPIINTDRELAEVIRAFEANYDYRRAKVIKDNRVGSKRMDHLAVIC